MKLLPKTEEVGIILAHMNLKHKIIYSSVYSIYYSLVCDPIAKHFLHIVMHQVHGVPLCTTV